MKPSPEKSPQEVLAGLVERVTYHNVENGFCVLRAKARGHPDVVTVVGHAATIAGGEQITELRAWRGVRVLSANCPELAGCPSEHHQRDEMVSAAVFPASLAASVTRDLRSWRTSSGRVRLQMMRSRAQI
jgi:hypothetical protein